MILYDKNFGSKFFFFMDEYYVLHFYQVKPTIKYYLVKIYIYNMYQGFFFKFLKYVYWRGSSALISNKWQLS